MHFRRENYWESTEERGDEREDKDEERVWTEVNWRDEKEKLLVENGEWLLCVSISGQWCPLLRSPLHLFLLSAFESPLQCARIWAQCYILQSTPLIIPFLHLHTGIWEVKEKRIISLLLAPILNNFLFRKLCIHCIKRKCRGLLHMMKANLNHFIYKVIYHTQSW